MSALNGNYVQGIETIEETLQDYRLITGDILRKARVSKLKQQVDLEARMKQRYELDTDTNC